MFFGLLGESEVVLEQGAEQLGVEVEEEADEVVLDFFAACNESDCDDTGLFLVDRNDLN